METTGREGNACTSMFLTIFSHVNWPLRRRGFTPCARQRGCSRQRHLPSSLTMMSDGFASMDVL